MAFDEAWHQISVSHIHGEESFDYIVNRSLLRPRNLLTIINYSKSNAVNLQHTKIWEEDIKKACSSYSADIGNEIGLEIRDVFPEAEDVLYYFIDAPANLTLGQVREYPSELRLSRDQQDRLIEILLWFGFLGMRNHKGNESENMFIYDVYYDMKKLRRLANNLNNENLELTIHRAFWPFLEIEEV